MKKLNKSTLAETKNNYSSQLQKSNALAETVNHTCINLNSQLQELKFTLAEIEQSRLWRKLTIVVV
jgi:hypothetical protein